MKKLKTFRLPRFAQRAQVFVHCMMNWHRSYEFKIQAGPLDSHVVWEIGCYDCQKPELMYNYTALSVKAFKDMANKIVQEGETKESK